MSLNSENDYQFYPTPLALAVKAWSKFKNKEFVRILEPSAGDGALIKASPSYAKRGYYDILPVDVCEIDFSKHAILRDIPGVSIVGMDFMEFGSGAIYSHILLNPPFSAGVSHVLKAWDILFDGEIVAIINAETVRNPYSRERKLLVSLIEQFGDVEFVKSAFAGEDAERKTEVEIALVSLCKKSNAAEAIVGTLLDDLQVENANLKAERLAQGYEQMQELMIPTTVLENSVMAFNAAVTAMRAAVIAEARASYYSKMLGLTMAMRDSEEDLSAPVDTSVAWVKTQIAGRYLTLKDQAWAGLLRSSQVTDKLSSKAQKRLESEFARIKELEFTVNNIYGFMTGLVENQGQIQLDMACDIFDLITRYHTDNLCFYKGWKSNDHHRDCGMRIKTTRFVIPSYGGGRFSLSCEAMCKIIDFDKVFAMLDGKQSSEVSLEYVFRSQFKNLCAGERISSSYFDVRYYPGAGTLHFFATNKALIDKLNKLVGEHRKWLPPADAKVSETFWQQYEKAEKLDKEMRAAIDDQIKANNKLGIRISSWDHPLKGLFNEDRSENSRKAVDDAMTKVLERHGISVDFRLEAPQSDEQGQMLLLAA